MSGGLVFPVAVMKGLFGFFSDLHRQKVRMYLSGRVFARLAGSPRGSSSQYSIK